MTSWRCCLDIIKVRRWGSGISATTPIMGKDERRNNRCHALLSAIPRLIRAILPARVLHQNNVVLLLLIIGLHLQ